MKQKFNEFLKTELNENQLKAVEEKNGAFLVIAGAGSGKTRVITARITNLILNHKVHPSEILALTFTNKAAREMKGRIEKFLPRETNLPFVGTFHSFCLLTLKKYKSFHKIENFSILDDEDQLKLIKLILNKFSLNKQLNPRQVQYQISNLKNNNLLDSDLAEIEDRLLVEILAAYEKEKRNSRCLDFDDLLIEVVKLFKTNKTFKENFQASVRHILVDEYQDTNNVQHELLKEMALNKNFALDSICAVGDEDQSIYSWRGAVVDNINHFKNDFKNTKLIKVEQNYRSVNQILDVANDVIKNNKNRNEKKLWSNKKADNRIIRTTSFSGTKEAELVAKYIKLAHKKDKQNSIAILYRTHFQSRLIEEALLRESINYKIIGGVQFYERKEIKDILAYLKIIVNPFDKISLFRILNCPVRGLGSKTEEIINDEWLLEPLLNYKELFKKLDADKKLPAKKIEVLNDFVKILDNFNFRDNTTIVIKELINKLEYLTYLKSEFEKKDAESRIENLNELIRASKYFEDQNINSVKEFLDEIALIQEQLNKKSDEEIQVQLMTIHAAKGLEFDHVIIVGLEEGLLPGNKALEKEELVEEERRLFYVGITRAKEYLIISNAKFRNHFGQTGNQIRSRFFDEISDQKVHNFMHTNYNDHELTALFSNFLNLAPQATFKPSVMTFQSESPKLVSEWKKNHFARHKIFGIGLIKEIEKKPESTIITLEFKAGPKKIDSKFLEKI